MSEETQDEPALDQHETTEQERLDGVIAQLRAHVAGEGSAVVEMGCLTITEGTQ